MIDSFQLYPKLAYWRLVIKFCITFKSRKASNDDISNPPIGGIIPLKIFKYGSVIDVSAESIPLLQSTPGNQVSKILIISKNE